MTADPPSSTDASHETATWESPGSPVTPISASGTEYGVTGADASDHGPAPAALVADTRNTYPVPLVNPVTSSVIAVTPVAAVVHDPPVSDEYSTV